MIFILFQVLNELNLNKIRNEFFSYINYVLSIKGLRVVSGFMLVLVLKLECFCSFYFLKLYFKVSKCEVVSFLNLDVYYDVIRVVLQLRFK